MKQKKKPSSLLRGFMKLVCTMLGLILAVMIAGTVYFHSLLNQINYVDPEDVSMLSQAEVDALLASDAEAPIETGDGRDFLDITFNDGGTTIGGKRSGIINILLIGQDRRPGEERARSDSMILCSINKKAKTLTLTSFLRDLYVDIPGYQDNRINVAYAAGGMTLLKETLETNFGLQVDGVVEVDFSQFSQIVDLLGGVKLELRQDEASLINRDAGGSLTEGTCLLNGQQALTYARIRKLDADGDFSRTSRQRKVINAILDAYKGASFRDLLNLVDEILPMVTTDIKTTRLVAYAVELFPLLSDLTIVSQQIPADGTYSGQMIRGMSVLVADMEANRQLLSETILGKTE